MAGDDYFDEKTQVIQPFSPGAFFADRYRVEAMLGAGATGSVFEATDLKTNTRVALKVIRSEHLHNFDVMERFEREARILSQVKHPGVVHISSFEYAPDGILFLAMELVKGETLDKVLEARGRLSPSALEPIVTLLAEALDEAHSVGAVHRDLKPANLVIPESGSPQIKILDFGLARLPTDLSLTGKGELLGTPRYMAPEQLESAKEVDARADVYSLGVIVFEALSGVSPYPAKDYGQLLGCLINGQTQSLAVVAPDLPDPFTPILARALAFDPEERFPSAGAFAGAYSAVLDHSHSSHPSPGGWTEVTMRDSKPPHDDG